MPFFFIDYWYLILVLPAVILTAWAQFKVHSTFKKYSGVQPSRYLKGSEASRIIQQENGIQVPIEMVQGSLSDHYDPRQNVIRLSETVYNVSSISAIGVAAHETGHALQYAEGYAPIQIRNAIVPVTRIASGLSTYLVLFGLLFFQPLAYIGVAFFGLAVIFQLLTLPVEFNASTRAMKALREGNMLTEEELAGVRKVLTAAAMTYVASLFLSLMSFLRLLIIVSGRGRRND